MRPSDAQNMGFSRMAGASVAVYVATARVARELKRALTKHKTTSFPKQNTDSHEGSSSWTSVHCP